MFKSNPLRDGEGMTKIAKTTEEAWDIQDHKDDEPHAWIQWKGTDACMDIHCSCGSLSHVDGYFAYHVKCPSCGKVFFCNGHIELIELEQEPDECLVVGV